MPKSKGSKTTLKKTTPSATSTKEVKSSKPGAMRTSEIRDLIDFISKTGLNEVNIETSELKLHVKREPDQKILKSAGPVVSSVIPQVAASPTVAAQIPVIVPTGGDNKKEASGKRTIEIKSPMIGTFYRSPNPDSPAFVNVGDKISKGQTVCIIEAMKLFNEIESEISGTIVRAPLENATPVEYDQILFEVEPD
jgi:acetyl-CoA carboxylase biotin carboxyl carrier protein